MVWCNIEDLNVRKRRWDLRDFAAIIGRFPPAVRHVRCELGDK